MNSTVNEITRSITGKTSLADCSVEELRQLAGQYPYFSPLQFLFTKKLKESNSSALEAQLEKAFLYFQNPVWLKYLLQSSTPVDTVVGSEPVSVDTLSTPGPEEPSRVNEISEQLPVNDDEEDLIPAGEPEERLEGNLISRFKFQPIDPNKAAMTFEPYHTVDYFASQGIKAKEEAEKPKDRFTQQLKSFTEWLKEMKRLPVTEVAASVSSTDEKKVEQMAEVSLSDREVLTEAMAEVWEKQGNHTKALEIYEKLSLLNPAKSSYFAAKIAHLKNL